MGIFNKTPEEIKKEEEQKKLRLLEEEIYSSNLDDSSKMFIETYLDKIKRGYNNPFYDIDTLIRVLIGIVDSEYKDYEDFEKHFKTVTKVFHKVVDINSEDFERNKDRFIDDFVGDHGVIYNGLYDDGIFSIFKNKEDYFDIMNLINNNPLLRNNFDIIKVYIQAVSKYCLNQDVLKRDIISYLDGYETVLEEDYEKYSEECLEDAKRRVGIYNLNPKELATVDTKLRRVESFLEQFGIYMTSIKEEKKALNTLVGESKKEIRKEKDDSINRLRQLIEVEKKLLMEKLDSYLIELEDLMKTKSDETFKQVIETYKKQIEEFRNLFKGYSLAASKDLIAIQNATEDSIKTLQSYVTNEPQLQQLLTKAQEQNQVREKIVQLVAKEEELLKVAKLEQPKEQVIIPGYDRVMVPYRHMILPEQIPTSIISALDERIPFDKRIKSVEDRMKLNEAKGEIYHKKVEQIAIDIMEGDWPYLWGPSGTGKSHMVKQVADLLGMSFMKAGKITEPHSILGYNDPQGRYRITPTFIAALYGHLLSLDEFDNGNPDTQVVLNDIYSELLNKIDNPNEVCEVMFGDDIPVNIHPNFRMIAAGNTSGEGENSVFSSRGKIDESIQERMTPIYIDYDNRVEEQILKDYPSWYKFFIDFREACSNFAQNNGLEAPQGTTTTRDAAAIKKYVDHNSKSLDQIIAERFIQIKDSEYRKALGKKIADIYQIDYSNCKNPEFKDELKKVDEKVLAKKFVYYCRKGVE